MPPASSAGSEREIVRRSPATSEEGAMMLLIDWKGGKQSQGKLRQFGEGILTPRRTTEEASLTMKRNDDSRRRGISRYGSQCNNCNSPRSRVQVALHSVRRMNVDQIQPLRYLYEEWRESIETGTELVYIIQSTNQES